MNEFAILAVKAVGDPPQPSDAVLYPRPLEAKNSVASEPEDGQSPRRIPAKAVSVVDLGSNPNRTLLKLRDVSIEVTVTDARVTLACSKYEKGGGWVGGAGAMIVLNAASKARAAYKRRGKMLVGHVRYSWLSAVGGHAKAGWGSEEQLRLCLENEAGRKLGLDIVLPKDVDSSLIAAEIARRAARSRLDVLSLSLDDRTVVQGVATARPLTNAKGEFALHRVPGATVARAGDASRREPVPAGS